ncbi:MAG: hydantoinase B/oxoprolinase family protein [Burkholderiaceae bacterium]
MDAVRLAVLKGRLEQIADEMDATLYRSAFNPIIAEAHDASHGLYDAASGDTLVQGKSGLPVFVGAMAFAVKAAIDAAEKQEGLTDGDTWLFNDPYDGGTHLNDFKLVRPFFYQGKLFCCLASVAHWHDVGGAVPGNYNPAATECWQEGMLIPPVRLIRKHVFNDDLMQVLTSNSRLPNSLYGDLNGQLAALDLGQQRLTSLLDEYGPEQIQQALSELRTRAVKLMQANILKLPEGEYACEDFLDNDGISDVPLRISVRIQVTHQSEHDGKPRLQLDFSETSPACAGPVNISKSTAIAACYVALKHIFPEVPANAGVLDSIDFVIPETALICAGKPKPVGGYTETILRMIDVIFGAMAVADPDNAHAMAYGTINALSIAGTRSVGDNTGKPWVMFSFFGGGHGAHPGGDGLAHGNAPISMATIPPLEILEASYPVAFTQWALRADSGGPGKFRGGLGAIYEIELLEQDAQAFVFGERSRFAPKGVNGGGAAAMNRISYRQNGQWHEPPMASKQVGIALTRGDRMRIESPGGGGCGNPSQRAPHLLESDIAAGYVTRSRPQ